MYDDICKLKKLFTFVYEIEAQIRKTTDLTANEVFVLCLLSKGVERPNDIAAELDLSLSRVSKIIGPLEEKELINRVLDKEDKRKFSFVLTKAGEEKVEKIKTIELMKFFEKNSLLKTVCSYF